MRKERDAPIRTKQIIMASTAAPKGGARMGNFDFIANIALISVLALVCLPAILLVHSAIRRIKWEAELRRRFRPTVPH